MTSRLIAIALSVTALTASAGEGTAALADEARCNMCHRVDVAMLGPSYQAIAERYKDDAAAHSLLAQRIREGSQGIWGEAMMPPVAATQLSDDDLATLVGWILNR